MTKLWFDDYRAALLVFIQRDCTVKQDNQAAMEVADHLAEKRKELEPVVTVASVFKTEPLPTPEEVADEVLKEHGNSLLRLEFTKGDLWGVVESVVREERERHGA